MKITIAKDELLLEALKSLYPNSSGRTLKNLLIKRCVFLDGTIITRGNYPVNKGQEISIKKTFSLPIKEFPILYEDSDILIIDKPVGLLSVPLDSEKAKNALQILRDHYQTSSIFAVHRIDRDTSGVLLFVKSKNAQIKMDELFRNHDLDREYIGLVEGHVTSSEGKWQSYLTEKSHFRVVSTNNPNEARLAITHYRVIRTTPKCTWLYLTLQTGRKHQIRVHCRDAGHPIVGDKEYNSSMNPYRRLCLHAHRIAFKHPITKMNIDITAGAVTFTRNLIIGKL